MNNIRAYNQLIAIYLIGAAIFCISAPAFALHPLITDDTGTQGKGKFELEMNFQHDHDKFTAREESFLDRKGEGILETLIEGYGTFARIPFSRVPTVNELNQAGAGITYGIIDNLDISVSIPYQHTVTRERGLYYTYLDPAGPTALLPPGFDPTLLRFCKLSTKAADSGFSDITAEVKWKFFEYKTLSLALKPGIILPVGNEDLGFGAGKLGGYGYFIMTLDYTPIVMHLNLGYIRNENSIDERKNIWHASLAFEFWLMKDYLRLVANTGLERNPDKRSKVQDVFVLAGLIGSPTPDVDIDFGVKYCPESKKLESPGPDYSLLGGVTIRFGSAGAEADDSIKDEKK